MEAEAGEISLPITSSHTLLQLAHCCLVPSLPQVLPPPPCPIPSALFAPACCASMCACVLARLVLCLLLRAPSPTRGPELSPTDPVPRAY